MPLGNNNAYQKGEYGLPVDAREDLAFDFDVVGDRIYVDDVLDLHIFAALFNISVGQMHHERYNGCEDFCRRGRISSEDEVPT